MKLTQMKGKKRFRSTFCL